MHLIFFFLHTSHTKNYMLHILPYRDTTRTEFLCVSYSISDTYSRTFCLLTTHTWKHDVRLLTFFTHK